jgi:hypothetical protein
MMYQPKTLLYPFDKKVNKTLGQRVCLVCNDKNYLKKNVHVILRYNGFIKKTLLGNVKQILQKLI